MKGSSLPSYTGHRFPPAIISHAVQRYFRVPLSLRTVEEILAACGIAAKRRLRKLLKRQGRAPRVMTTP